MAGRPKLMVAVTGYPNPYPKSTDTIAKIAELCVPLIDTIPTCTARWVQLPPALEVIDQVFKKLNTTIENAVKPFAIGSGGRFVFVDTHTKTRDHCMKMEVTIKTRSSIRGGGAVHEHDSPAVNFGCSSPGTWPGTTATKMPDYPRSRRHRRPHPEEPDHGGHGHPSQRRRPHRISDLIFEADTLEPGVTP